MMSKDKDKDKDKQQKENKIERGLRPKVFTDVIGREKEKESLRIMIKAAQERGEALDHILFHGPPGLGKTTLAHVVAKEMGADIMVTSGPAIERQGDLASIITNISENGILFIDEIHRLNKVVEEIMYPAMEDNVLDIIIGKGPSAKTIRLDLPRFTVIGATTRIGLISSPLRNRFGASYRLDYYNTEELVGIVEQKASMLEMEITENGALEIARRSRGTPRIAVRLVKRVRDYAQVNTRSEIDESVASKALEMQKIDEKGLDDVDRKILSTIVEKFQGGPVGLTTISAAISEELDTLSDVYEPFLIQAGMLKKTPRGRVVTKEGYMHLGVEYEKHQDKLL